MDILFMCLSLYGDVVLYVDMDIYVTHMSTDGPVFYMIGLCPYIYIYLYLSLVLSMSNVPVGAALGKWRL